MGWVAAIGLAWRLAAIAVAVVIGIGAIYAVEHRRDFRSVVVRNDTDHTVWVSGCLGNDVYEVASTQTFSVDFYPGVTDGRCLIYDDDNAYSGCLNVPDADLARPVPVSSLDRHVAVSTCG